MKQPHLKQIHLAALGIMLAVAGIWTSCKKEEKNAPSDDWPTDAIRTVKHGLNYPWEILWGKDDFIWMTEKLGKISKLDPKTGDVLFSSKIDEVVSVSEGGLLGMVQHPDFLNNGFIYVVYNYYNGPNYLEKVVRLTYENGTLSSPLTLIENISASDIHNGSRLWITEENPPKLFISTGDASNPALSQDANSPNGKILRLNLDGTIPDDNPIAGNPMWSMGHRNPQGMVMVNGNLYVAEHGPSIEDEINIIEKGRNFGWPIVNGPCDDTSETAFCSTYNVKPPLWSSGNTFTVAGSGLDYYNGDSIPQWKNSLLLATLKNKRIYQIKLSADGQSVVSTKEYFFDMWGRLRDFCISPAGRIYLCTSNGGTDALIEISKPE
jgi:aldose sugar dehydrogenase